MIPEWNQTKFKLAGVNVGGWLVLEDWFFSGTGGTFVGSPPNLSQGVCLPPNLPRTDEPWPSEGILTSHLVKQYGETAAINAFAAHREAFFQEEDYQQIAGLGMKSVRIPLPWTAFADALAPLSAELYGAHDPYDQATVVPDPFYPDDASYVTVPRKRLFDILWTATRNGLKVVFDIHTMPGGSSYGTYNGVWPMWPAFWNGNSTLTDASGNKVSGQELGIWISIALIRWVEGLEPTLRQSVSGLALMNEPAHQAASQRKAGNSFADELDVWDWLVRSADLFRRSTLPAQGVKLYVNLIDSAFETAKEIETWWFQTFTKDERDQWAVIDIHWYAAWSDGDCDGRSDVGGAYACDQPPSKIRELLKDCTSGWSNHFAGTYDGLKAISEFSVGTFKDAQFSCHDALVLRIFLEEQILAFNRRNIEPFFWTWRMPYGTAFEAGWSLKRILGQERPSPPCER
eukprot:TRINITY_DN949_c0_g1_i1.p1 TRINITY_DN949_c0_g1~~TRINITY_DN949_c0_g1_i1.p1  ORF type:complete len:534 (+),score=66.20 TRINITY_DN949_c0_g1_i1:231-1604(+)